MHFDSASYKCKCLIFTSTVSECRRVSLYSSWISGWVSWWRAQGVLCTSLAHPMKCMQGLSVQHFDGFWWSITAPLPHTCTVAGCEAEPDSPLARQCRQFGSSNAVRSFQMFPATDSQPVCHSSMPVRLQHQLTTGKRMQWFSKPSVICMSFAPCTWWRLRPAGPGLTPSQSAPRLRPSSARLEQPEPSVMRHVDTVFVLGQGSSRERLHRARMWLEIAFHLVSSQKVPVSAFLRHFML